ncbi:MAG: hypothetical protein HY898_32060 [Deltaproteobacteria bacterium]|nr:hypothetical protein [Deltaproteobacteria bacterium]
MREDDQSWTLLESGSGVATTPHEENLFEMARIRVPAQVETGREGWLWLHAAAMLSPRGSCVMLVGRSGIGKSTSALMLARAGWKLLADDRVLFDPISRSVLGMNWAIRMDGPPHELSFLREEGFAVHEDRWIGEEVQRCASLVVPPRSCLALPPGPMPVSACLVLERCSAGVERRTVGEMLPLLWPQRIARSDGTDPSSPAGLAAALSSIPMGVLSTRRAREVVGALESWLEGMEPR